MDIKIILFIVMSFTFFLNMAMTHFRKTAWFPYRTRWGISIVLSIIGIIGFLCFRHRSIDEIWASMILITPLLLTTIDCFLKRLSIKYQDRDWEFNTSIEFVFPQSKKEFSGLDHAFTFLTLIIIAVLFFAAYQFAKLII